MNPNQPLMSSGASRMKSRHHLQQLGALLERPDHRAAVDRADRVQPEHERGDDPEVAAAAAHRPEEILVVLGVRGHEATVGQHHVDAQEVVDGEPVGARQVADAAAEGQPADAGGRDEAARGGQAEGVGGVVDVAPACPALDADRACLRIHPDAVHPREVDDQTVVDGAQPRSAVPTAAHRQRQLLLAGEVDRGDDIGHVDAAGDQRRAPVDHAVVDLARLLVAGSVAGANQIAAHSRAEVLHCLLVKLAHRSLLGGPG